jgi:hypothetical protein
MGCLLHLVFGARIFFLQVLPFLVMARHWTQIDAFSSVGMSDVVGTTEVFLVGGGLFGELFGLRFLRGMRKWTATGWKLCFYLLLRDTLSTMFTILAILATFLYHCI